MKESAKITNPAYSVDRIVARMTEAAARAGQLPDAASVDVVASAEFRAADRGQPVLAGVEIEPLKLQPPFHPSSDGRYHVNDLLQYHDRNFIQNAFRAILKRGPDATGYRGFIESLRSARLNKIDILARLRYSAEGRAKQVEIEGLQLPALIRRAYRVPFFGYLLNLAVALGRLPSTIRAEQQFEAHVLAQQEMVVEHLNHVGRTLRLHAAEASGVLQTQAESIKELDTRAQLQIGQTQLQLDQTQLQLEQTQLQIEQTRQQLDLIGQAQMAFHQDLTDSLARQAEGIRAQFSELQHQFTIRLDEEAAHRDRERQAFGKQLDEATTRSLEKFAAFEAGLLQGQEKFAAFETSLLQSQEALRLTETELRQADLSRREQLELTARTLKGEMERIFQKVQQVNTELVLQGDRLQIVLAEARQRLPAPFDEAQLRALAAEEDHTLDAFYASFDEQFRGRREEIKERLKVYLPIVKQRGIGGAARPVLDVGCGRGEWLELLKEEQLQASGIDSNRILVAWCRNLGLDVSEADLITYLQEQPPSSLGALTGFHIIEHLAIETLVEFLNQAMRVLEPGGAVIFETPNPQNVLVGSCNFYFDPSHRNPLPSQVTTFLLESRGFTGVQILKLNPSDDTPVPEDSELARRFNQYFYGPMDYAVVGWKV